MAERRTRRRPLSAPRPPRGPSASDAGWKWLLKSAGLEEQAGRGVSFYCAAERSPHVHAQDTQPGPLTYCVRSITAPPAFIIEQLIESDNETHGKTTEQTPQQLDRVRRAG